jgi:hypothetical protein
MEKKEIYRVRKGNLINEKHDLPLEFGLIYDTNGVITAEFYIEEGHDLEKLVGITYDEKDTFYNAFCTTDKGDSLELRKLDFRHVSPGNSFLKMICLDCFIHTENKEYLKDEKDNAVEPVLHYVVLEGLDMEYCIASTLERTSSRGKSMGGSEVEWDHTSCGWSCGTSLYNMDFYKDHKNGSVIVKFDNSSNSILSYKEFLKLKKDYTALLSFVTGAPVKIRKECYGYYYTVGKPNAENNVFYSFSSINNNRKNQYLPIHHHMNRSINILGKIMMQNYNNFSEWNTKIDLNSIIYYLTGSIQARSIEEQFFILIIAFERLTALYAEQTGPQEIYHPSSNDYRPIKDELFAVLDNHSTEFGTYLDRAKSVIGGLNQVKRLSTKDKMYGLLTDLNIDLTDDVKNLIDIVRNKAVHKGDIGDGEEGHKNVILLNELIHEIILRLIKYLGPRKSTVIFGRTIMTIDTPLPGIPVFEKKHDI